MAHGKGKRRRVAEPDGGSTPAAAAQDKKIKSSARQAQQSELPELRRGKELYRAPTQGELRELHETESLFKSNLFKLQIDEMLKEIRPAYERQGAVEQALHKLKTALTGISAVSERQVSPSTDFGKGLRAPIAVGSEIAETKFTFHPPTQVSVVGSYLLKAVAKPRLHVDVAVQIPSETMQEKDFLNHRYFHKRAYFLATIAAALDKKGIFATISFSCAQGDPLKPILILKPKPNEEQRNPKFEIRLHPCIDASVFKVQKLSPDRNSVRRAKSTPLLPADAPAATDAETATPRYNNAVLADMLMQHHLELIHRSTSAVEGMVDCIMLVKTWLRQRGMHGDAFGTLNGFVATMLVIHLLQTRKIFPQSSSFQMFRAVVAFIASSNWSSEGVQMKFTKFSDAFPPDYFAPKMAVLHESFDVVFTDPSGCLNLLSAMTVGAYQNLRHEAQLAMKLLENPVVDGFDSLFMVPVKFEAKFDLIVRCSDIKRAIARRYPAQLLDRGGDWEAFALSFLASVTRRGLGKRAKLVVPLPRQAQRWGLRDQIPLPVASATGAVSIVLGVIIDQQRAFERVEMGPPAEAEGAAPFRDFWGPVADLRRFADGSVMEAVLWDLPPSASHLIPRDIIKHVLERHGTVCHENVGVTAGICDTAMTRHGCEHDTSAQDALTVITRLDELLRELRSIGQSLPLSIAALQGVSTTFRYTEPFPPQKQESEDGSWPSFIPALEVILRFESSTQWPDDVVAIEKVKVAFYLRLAALVKSKLKLPTTATQQFIDIFCKPYVFRLIIFAEREFNIAKGKTDSLASMLKAAPGAELKIAHASAAALSNEMERFYIRTPEHSGFVHGIHLQHNGFATSIRLAKRWLCAHLFSGLISDEAVELMVAHLYLHPQPYEPPASGHVGFLRFLHQLHSFDWQHDPLVVDTNGEMTAADYVDIAKKFRDDRGSFPPVTILTTFEKTSSRWTTDSPTARILPRIKLFAKESAALLAGHIRHGGMGELGGVSDISQLFRTSLDEYDVLIKLNRSAMSRRGESIDAGSSKSSGGQKKKYKNLEAAESDDVKESVLVGHDVVQLYLGDLRARYGHAALFFYDQLGGDTVAVVWDPQALAPHPFRAAFSQDAIPHITEGKGDTELKVRLNVDAVMHGFKQLGQGLVKSVKAKTA